MLLLVPVGSLQPQGGSRKEPATRARVSVRRHGPIVSKIFTTWQRGSMSFFFGFSLNLIYWKLGKTQFFLAEVNVKKNAALLFTLPSNCAIVCSQKSNTDLKQRVEQSGVSFIYFILFFYIRAAVLVELMKRLQCFWKLLFCCWALTEFSDISP